MERSLWTCQRAKGNTGKMILSMTKSKNASIWKTPQCCQDNWKWCAGSQTWFLCSYPWWYQIHDGLGCAFLLPFPHSGTPPKGIPAESFIFLPFVKESFLIFLQFEPPPKGMLFTDSKGIHPFLFIPLFPNINDWVPIFHLEIRTTWALSSIRFDSIRFLVLLRLQQVLTHMNTTMAMPNVGSIGSISSH